MGLAQGVGVVEILAMLYASGQFYARPDACGVAREGKLLLASEHQERASVAAVFGKKRRNPAANALSLAT